jgi:hypothetical protein
MSKRLDDKDIEGIAINIAICTAGLVTILLAALIGSMLH